MKSYADNELEQTFYYFWENQKLMGYIVKDATGSDKYIVKMLYDNSDDSIGYELYDSAENETETMYFQKNLQGDITGVYNFNYGELLTYTYDAWGNVTVENPTFSVDQVISTVDALLYTPITYRGYMYDVYTGLYYLQSRYYNPAYGRFLNVDDTDILEVTQGTSLGANLFTYCNNNPVMNVDYAGQVGYVALIVMIIFIIVILIFVFLDNSMQESILEMLRDAAIEKMLKEYPTLLKLFKFDSTMNDVLDMNNEYVEIFLLFYAHAKNIVDYGTGKNNDPYYPNYYDICPNGISYKERCRLAYNLAVESGFISSGVLWKDVSPELQYLFVKEMMFYDTYMWEKLVFFSTKKMGVWGTKELAMFYFGFFQILEIEQ